MLELCNISKKYKEKIALNDVSLKLDNGIYGLLGPNGAGKSTLMNIITGNLEPTEGTIKWEGKEVKELGSNYRSLLGYAPQQQGMYETFSGRRFLSYMATLKGIPKSSMEDEINRVLLYVNMVEKSNQKIGTYSGGMKQRILIAQAIIGNPKLVILDEPTAGLDPKERVKFRNLISSFSQDKIVILSTHIVSDIEFIADRIIVMKQGNKILEGTPEELLRALNGKVWKCTVYDKKEVAELNSIYCIINIHQENNYTELRIVSDKQPYSHAVNVEPNLEDLYLAYFQDSEK